MAEKEQDKSLQGLVRKEEILEKFAEWLAHPVHARVPKTQAQFAKENKISETTLCRWKIDDPWAAIFWGHYEKVKNRVMRQYTPEVESRLYQMAVRRSASSKHIGLWFDHVEKDAKNINLNIQGNLGMAIADMSDEQLQTYIDKVGG